MRRLRSALLALTLLAGTVPLAGQAFRTQVDLIQVSVTVTDAGGRFVTGLGREAFEVWEDGTPQPVAEFSDARVPVSVGLLVDASDSMRGQGIQHVRAAVDAFLGDGLRPEDEAFVATFTHRARLVSPWRQPPASIRGVLDTLQPGGGTAVWDAVAETPVLFARRRHARAALVLVSDGADTASDRTPLQALDAVRPSDATVYAIAIDAPDARPSARPNPGALREISALTGGYTEVVRTGDALAAAAARIADELDAQYTLGYVTRRPFDGSWRSIRVRVGSHRVRHRRGFVARPMTGR